MKQYISSNKLAGTITDISCSKSYANRAIVYSYLKSFTENLSLSGASEDVIHTLKAVDEIDENEVYLGEGGTTIRFMLPLFANKKTKTLIKVHPRFKQRPMQEFYKYLRQLGAKIEVSDKEDELCVVSGPLKHNESLEVDCTKTTQFASSLMLIAPFINLDLKFINLKSSLSYLKMTASVIESLDKKEKFTAPVDMSSASYFIGHALLNQELTFPQITKRDELQADDTLLSIIENIGGKYSISSEGLRVYKADKLRPLDIDVSNCIDLTMTLVYLALFIEGEHSFRGIENLRYKETDRLAGIMDILKQLGAKFSLKESTLRIEGLSHKGRDNLEPMPDHRLVMMSALIIKQMGAGTVSNTGAVSKSFPQFFDLLNP